MSDLKHTFNCGIVGTSYDAAGDEFLAGMMRAEEMDLAHMRRIEKQLADAEAVRRDRDAATRIIAVLVARAGGEVFIPDGELLPIYFSPAKEVLITHRDEAKGGAVIRVRKVGEKTENDE